MLQLFFLYAEQTNEKVWIKPLPLQSDPISARVSINLLQRRKEFCRLRWLKL